MLGPIVCCSPELSFSSLGLTNGRTKHMVLIAWNKLIYILLPISMGCDRST